MSIKLYASDTYNAHKVLVLLEEANIDYQLIKVNLRAREHLTDDFKKLNPNAKIPVLVDDEFVISESCAILTYLSRKYNKFIKVDLQEQSKQLERLFLIDSTFTPNFGPLWFMSIFKPDDDRSKFNRNKMEVNRLLELFNDIYKHDNFLNFHEYSITDMALLPIIHALENSPLRDEFNIANHQFLYKAYQTFIKRANVQKAFNKFK